MFLLAVYHVTAGAKAQNQLFGPGTGAVLGLLSDGETQLINESIFWMAPGMNKRGLQCAKLILHQMHRRAKLRLNLPFVLMRLCTVPWLLTTSAEGRSPGSELNPFCRLLRHVESIHPSAQFLLSLLLNGKTLDYAIAALQFSVIIDDEPRQFDPGMKGSVA
jgi:hypothetical protein